MSNEGAVLQFPPQNLCCVYVAFQIEAKIESDVYKFKKKNINFRVGIVGIFFFLKSSPGFLENKDDETS